MADKNVELKLRNVRLSFANLFEPQEFENDDGSIRYTYNTNILIPKLIDGKPNPDVARCQEAVKQAMAAKWGDNPPRIPTDRRCFRDGEPKHPDTDVREPLYEGYAGHCFISANKPVKKKDSPNPLILIDSRKGADGKFPKITEADGKLYSGAYVDVIVRIYGFDGAAKKVPSRVNASLEAIKFVRHGEAFGAKKVDANSAFDEEEAEDGFDEPAAGGKPAADADDDMFG